VNTADPVAAIALAVGILVVGALLVVGWRRSRAVGAGGGRIELVTSRYLGGKRVLTLVDVEGERLLLALSGNTVRLVARINSRPRRRARADFGARPGSVPARPRRPESWWRRARQTEAEAGAETEAKGDRAEASFVEELRGQAGVDVAREEVLT
jgi:hypothetical protein